MSADVTVFAGKENHMELGMIGLGRMGTNMVRRLMRAGHHCIVFDTKTDAVQALAKEGASGATLSKTLPVS
jgi:6-phosphogluconate dehydrogenase (decarboxylating)